MWSPVTFNRSTNLPHRGVPRGRSSPPLSSRIQGPIPLFHRLIPHPSLAIPARTRIHALPLHLTVSSRMRGPTPPLNNNHQYPNQTLPRIGASLADSLPRQPFSISVPPSPVASSLVAFSPISPHSLSYHSTPSHPPRMSSPAPTQHSRRGIRRTPFTLPRRPAPFPSSRSGVPSRRPSSPSLTDHPVIPNPRHLQFRPRPPRHSRFFRYSRAEPALRKDGGRESIPAPIGAVREPPFPLPHHASPSLLPVGATHKEPVSKVTGTKSKMGRTRFTG